MTTKAVRAEGPAPTSYAEMGDIMVADLMQGAPESFSDPGPESPVVVERTNPPMEVGLRTAPPGKVSLRNIKYVNERFLINGEMIGFTEGDMVTDRGTADYIKAAAPYVYEEPNEGYVFTHSSGFVTRNPAAYEEYCRYAAENTG
ncbi:MAG TPA: hypothetical protein VNJ04_19760 [Gemmatimonadaceae bacterium]|nr:hypothetical protein [Gemmatimonadaceae bacterium]